eukprot:snap_masked-scaffold_8-processed-gene-14.70-mRNA-1 protein AED:1.00 eAED:1.00 QI:0/-1/0/0/-1/1/1/0/72
MTYGSLWGVLDSFLESLESLVKMKVLLCFQLVLVDNQVVEFAALKLLCFLLSLKIFKEGYDNDLASFGVVRE